MKFYETRICPSINVCIHCPLFKKNNGLCSGCSIIYNRKCLKMHCDFYCNKCSGGRLSQNEAVGCCGRVNLLNNNYFGKVMKYEIPNYTPKPINYSQTLIPILIWDIRKYKIPSQFKNIEVWSVLLHDVMRKNGEFKSNDLKDLFSIDNDQKILLSTSSNDYLLEVLWNKKQNIDFSKFNIDYWLPGHFSIYENDSKYYQHSSLKRQQIHGYESKSQFIWFRLSNTIDIENYADYRDFPSIAIYTASVKAKISKEIVINEIQTADNYFNENSSFFFIGGYSFIPKLKTNRKIYVMSQKWSYNANMNMDLYRDFGDIDVKPDKNMLLINNLKEEIKNVETKFNDNDGRR